QCPLLAQSGLQKRAHRCPIWGKSGNPLNASTRHVIDGPLIFGGTELGPLMVGSAHIYTVDAKHIAVGQCAKAPALIAQGFTQVSDRANYGSRRLKFIVAARRTSAGNVSPC